ncbi:PucR family transcriptional regulator [Evansella sp. AB-rgal1]|uniref:PucR family transcriptional regulator n=1 Tax=Evansella sp. AB-rgal1 TaxID=3242696 RepID=UPI00359D4312
MKILQLYEHLEHFHVSKELSHPAREISNIEILTANRDTYDINTIYIWNSNVELVHAAHSNFVVEESEVTVNHDNSNFLFVQKEKLDDIGLFIIEVINQEKVVKKAEARLFYEMLKGEELTISSLLQTASELLGNPVTLTGSTFRLIEMYPNQILHDPVWDALHSQGFLEQDYIMLFEADTTRRKTLESNKPILLNWSWAEKHPRISGIVIDGKRVYGYLGVMEYYRKFTSADYEITHLLCKVFRTLLKRKSTPSNDTMILQQTFLANLLDGGVSSVESLELARQSSDIHFEAPFCIFVIPLTMDNSQNMILNQMYDQLYLKIGNMYTINHSSNLVLFLFGKNIARSINLVSDLLTNSKIIFSISEQYDKLIQTQIYYRRGIAAYELGLKSTPDKAIFHYSNYVYKHVIDSAVSKEGEEIFLLAGVQELIKYDEMNHTQYARTLQAYLHQYKNATETAKLLDVHRNTLNYRLKKCEEIADINYDDNNLCRHIQISLDVLLK